MVVDGLQPKDRLQRWLEILPGVFSWSLITLPVWLSLWAPRWVAYFVLFFLVYWLYRSAQLGINSVRGYLNLRAYQRIDWMAECKRLDESPFKWQQIRHVIIIPTYKEPIGVLDQTIAKVKAQTFPAEQIMVVIATEERDPQSRVVTDKLRDKYAGDFGGFWVTAHPDIVAEVKGKSSNMAYAGKWVKNKLEESGQNIDHVTVTSCDADARLPAQYYACLTYKFLTDPQRYVHFYQGTLLFYNNIWQVPLPVRVINTVGSILNLAQQMRPDKLINVSTYTLSLRLCDEVGYWSVDVIPEDWHLFFKAFFHKGDQVSVVPIYLPIHADAAQSVGYVSTMVNQYEQMKRWAWGVTDVPYVIRGWLEHKEIPLVPRTLRVLRALENHLLWPVNWFIVTLGGTLPAIINPAFGETVLGRNLPIVAANILTLCTVFLVVVIVIDALAKPPRPDTFPRQRLPMLLLQWATLPVVGFFFGALPGIDAHTRLMLGRYLEYRVTEKVDLDESVESK